MLHAGTSEYVLYRGHTWTAKSVVDNVMTIHDYILIGKGDCVGLCLDKKSRGEKCNGELDEHVQYWNGLATGALCQSNSVSAGPWPENLALICRTPWWAPWGGKRLW